MLNYENPRNTHATFASECNGGAGSSPEWVLPSAKSEMTSRFERGRNTIVFPRDSRPTIKIYERASIQGNNDHWAQQRSVNESKMPISKWPLRFE